VQLVFKSPGIRRLLGPQLASDGASPPSMQAPSRTFRAGARTGS
jgi:hypothetical protein